MPLPRLRQSVFHCAALALAVPPILALTDALLRGSLALTSWYAVITWPVLLMGAAFLGAPISLPLGMLGGCMLSWWAGRTPAPQRLPFDAAVMGAALASLAWMVMDGFDEGYWGVASPAMWLLPVLGGPGGWVAARAVFEVGRRTHDRD